MSARARFLVVLLAFLAPTVEAQAPGSGRALSCDAACGAALGAVPLGGTRPLATPVRTFYGGAQVGYTFASKGSVDEVSDFFAARLELLLEGDDPQNKGWGHALSGNLGKINLDEPLDAATKVRGLLNSAGGLQLTYSPFYSTGRTGEDARQFVTYGNIGVKANRQRELADTSQWMIATQWRISAGIDASFGKISEKNPRPTSVIVEAVYGYLGGNVLERLTGVDRDYLTSIEATVVRPIKSIDGASLLFQGVLFQDGGPLWRIGTLVYAKSKDQKDD